MADHRTDCSAMALADQTAAFTGKPVLALADSKALRQELARAFGATPQPSKKQLQAAFVEGARVVLELQKDNKIQRRDADLLLKALCTLFTTALVRDIAEGMFHGRTTDLSVQRWFGESLR